MSTKNFYFAGLLSFLFCAGSVEASRQSSQHMRKQPIDDALEKDKEDKEHFIQQIKQSKYYDFQESLEDASEDYLYLANLLSQWGMEEVTVGVAVKQRTERLVEQLKNQKTNPQKPWEKLLLGIANRYIEKKDGGEIFKNQILDSMIANYNLMSFTDVKTIQQKGQEKNGKYRLLNDWGVLFFHCNEDAIAYGDRENKETKREVQVAQNDWWMEEKHDYVQLWYPIFSISGAHRKAPRMSPVLFQKIKRDQTLLSIYRQSIGVLFDRTLKFMGLKYDASDKKIIKTNSSQHISWIKNSHNFMRINRYLQALSIVGMGEERDALLNYLRIGSTNWQQFCDNDRDATGKEVAYQQSMGYWFEAREENAAFMGQVDKSASAVRKPFFHSNTESISKIQSVAVVDTPAPQPISSGNSAAPQQKIRKNKAQGKRQRRRGRKTNRKTNRNSNRKSRKARKKIMR